MFNGGLVRQIAAKQGTAICQSQTYGSKVRVLLVFLARKEVEKKVPRRKVLERHVAAHAHGNKGAVHTRQQCVCCIQHVWQQDNVGVGVQQDGAF